MVLLYFCIYLGQEPRIRKAFDWWIPISDHRTPTGCFHLVTSLLSLENLLKLPSKSSSCASQQPEYIVYRQITRAALWPSLVSTLLCCAGVWGCIYFYLKNLLISNFDPNCLDGILLAAGIYFLTQCMNTDCPTLSSGSFSSAVKISGLKEIIRLCLVWRLRMPRLFASLVRGLGKRTCLYAGNKETNRPYTTLYDTH